MVSCNYTYKQNYILIDIDNCLSPITGVICDKEQSLWLLNLNLSNIAKICNNYNVGLYIFPSKVYDNQQLTYLLCKNNLDEYFKIIDVKDTGAGATAETISKLFKELIQNKGIGNVIIMSNDDYRSSVNPNNKSYYIKVNGLITYDNMNMVKNILTKYN